MPRKRRVYSIADELLSKSRDAALAAIQVFNNPLMRFKSESYIVLMIIAWTYLLHAYYRKNGIEYRYYRMGKSRRRFDRTKSGAFKYWELERCLNDAQCPVDRDVCNNLRFLIQLRHEIEHQMTMQLDEYLGGRYQACAVNYNRYIKSLFGDNYGIDTHLTYSLQFLELSYDQLMRANDQDMIPARLQAFILSFDESLTEEEFNSEAFSYRLYFSKKMANRPGQADKVVEFLDPNSPEAQAIDKAYWVKKEVERPKYLPSEIVRRMREKGYTLFNMYHHTKLWKSRDAKNPGKGYGIQVSKQWYWYETWIKEVEKHCDENSQKYIDPNDN